MQIVNMTPYSFAPLPGQINFPNHSLTLIVKGTFDLKPGVIVEPSQKQLQLSGDVFYPDDTDMTGSFRYESDFVWYKPRADILLAGHCHAPGGKPTQACRVYFRVGTLSRALYVFGDRFWKGLPGMKVISDPIPFTSMELRYENSFGGHDYESNPAGKGFGKKQTEEHGTVYPLPNIEDPSHLIDSPSSTSPPAGFGPIARYWKPRKGFLGTYTDAWKRERWPWFPEDFSWQYCNAAPIGQQYEGYLRGDEPLLFENLHPTHARYNSTLPGLKVRCFLNTAVQPDSETTRFHETTMRLDTIWADMDSEQVALVWRGSAEVLSDEYEEVLHVFIMQEPLNKTPRTLEQCHRLFLDALEGKAEERTMEPEVPKEPKQVQPSLPGLAGIPASITGTGITGAVEPKHSEQTGTEPIFSPPPINDESIVIDPADIKSQAALFLAESGVDLNSMSPEMRASVETNMDKVIARFASENPSKILEEQQSTLDLQLTDGLAKLGIDRNNLPALTDRAREEQTRLLKELGFEAQVTDSGAESTQDIREMQSIIASLFGSLGLNPENLSPLIEFARVKNIKNATGGKS